VVKGEMSAKTTYQKSAKGPVSIAECAADGKSITLENVGRKVSPLLFFFLFFILALSRLGKSSESVQYALLKACDACADMGQL